MTTEREQQETISLAGISAFFTAMRFLTVIPVSWRAAYDGQLFPKSINAFPLIGLFIGALGFVLCKVAATVVPLSVTVFLAVFYLSAISGFLHLDGLADSADGLLSARPREQSLAIMKDSRTGAMGAIVLVLVLLGKYAALSAMPPQLLYLALFFMPLAGRTAIVVTMACHRYARPEGGIGGLFYSAGTRAAAVAGVIVLTGVTFAAGGTKMAGMVVLVMAFTVFWFGRFCRARLGGVTGDTLGAVCELTELSVALGLTAGLQ